MIQIKLLNGEQITIQYDPFDFGSRRICFLSSDKKQVVIAGETHLLQIT